MYYFQKKNNTIPTILKIVAVLTIDYKLNNDFSFDQRKSFLKLKIRI